MNKMNKKNTVGDFDPTLDVVCSDGTLKDSSNCSENGGYNTGVFVPYNSTMLPCYNDHNKYYDPNVNYFTNPCPDIKEQLQPCPNNPNKSYNPSVKYDQDPCAEVKDVKVLKGNANKFDYKYPLVGLILISLGGFLVYKYYKA